MAGKTLRFIVPLIAAAGLLAAADFWETRPASDWNEKEVRRLLTKSPWAKEVSAGLDSDRKGRGGQGGGGMGRGGQDPGGRGGLGGRGGGGVGGDGMGRSDGMGGPGGGGMGRSGGGMGEPGAGATGAPGAMDGGSGRQSGSFDAPRMTVRWLSSGPMQHAALKTDAMKELAEWSKEFYVLAVAGMHMGMGAGVPSGEGRVPRDGTTGSGPGQQNSADPQQRIAMMKERMMESSTLQIGGRGPMQAARVEIVRGETGPVMVLLFPRVSDITIGDKDVQFQTAAGPLVVKARFPLKDMSVKGKLEL